MVDVGQWITQESTLPSNLLLTEMLLSERMHYSVISEDNLNILNSGDVYIFPYNPYISQDILEIRQ